jgi:four helix bundle protein
MMNEAQFKARTRKLGLDVIRVLENVPYRQTAKMIGGQLLRSATSVGANYRAACRAQSTAAMIAKLSIVEEEADETMYWLEMLAETGLVSRDLIQPLMSEANAITAMTVASIKTLRSKRQK